MKVCVKKSFLVALVLSLGLVSLVGCHSKKHKNEDPVLKAYRLIDAQRTDEAIELLEAELVHDPDNAEYKSVLATAYGHKGGIKIQRLVPLVSKAERINQLKDILTNPDPHDSKSRKLDIYSQNASGLMMKYAVFFETLMLIPEISAEQETYLRHAIFLIEDLGDKKRQDDAIYKAILEIVLFKHIVAENLYGELIERGAEDAADCKINISLVNDTFTSLGSLLMDILDDIAFANPDQAPDMQRLKAEVAKGVSNLTVASTSVIVLGNSSDNFLRQAARDYGFGKIVRCNGN